MKKTKKYMGDEDFNELLESLNQVLQYEQGERDGFRVTVLEAPANAKKKTVAPKKSLKQTIADDLEGLSKAKLKQVADYVAFLKYRERAGTDLAERRAA